MKHKLILQAVLLLALSFCFQFAFATGGGSVMGRVTDPDTKAPAADVTVVFECQGNQLGFTTNDSGYYYASNLPVGVYTVTASYMSNHSTVTGVRVGDEAQKIVDIALSVAVDGKTVFITDFKIPVIDPVEVDKVQIPREEFKNEPLTKLADLTSQQSGVTDINGVFYVHGAREGSLKYYIDGGPIMAQADIPLCGLENYTIYTGFIPPKYGDSVGGVVVLETRNFFSSIH